MAWFDASTVDMTDDRQLLPAGWYTAMITEANPKMTQNGHEALNLYVQILAPQKGMVFELLNLNHPKTDVKGIAERTLAKICHAVGVLQPRGPEDIMNKPFMVKLKIKPAQGQYDASNGCADFKAIGAAETMVQQAPAFAAPPAAVIPTAPAAASSAPPWMAGKAAA